MFAPYVFDTCLPRSRPHTDRWSFLWSPGIFLCHTRFHYTGLSGQEHVQNKLRRENHPELSWRTLITDRVFLIGTFLIIPLPPVWSRLDVELHTKICGVVVVWFIVGPRVLPNPRAVITDPGPVPALVFLSDSNPVIWALTSVWQPRHQIVILLLVLDDHQVCVSGLAPRSGLFPVHGLIQVMIRPAQGHLSKRATWRVSVKRKKLRTTHLGFS